MRVHPCLVVTAVSFLFLGCVSHVGGSHKPIEATVEQMLSSPGQLDGSRVVVKGFLLQPMVGDIALYQTEPGYHQYAPEKGIRLALDPQKRNLMPFQLKQCVVEGTFHASHAPGVRGGIGEITRLELAQ